MKRMKKKKKERKKTEDETKFINALKDCLNEYDSKSNQIRNLAFKEETDGDNMRFSAILDYGSFEQRIYYYPFMLLSENVIDVVFSFDKSEYIYSFYDIFNLFDIDDFNLYFYEDLLSADEVKSALNDILNATERYSYYLEKAQTDEYLPVLEKNYETDMENAYGGSEWKEDEDGHEICFFPINHIFYSAADAQITEKTLKKLRKKNAKGKLGLIYEKRLLNYLESGKTVTRKSLSDKSDFEKLYKSGKRKVYALIFVLSAALVFALSFGIHAVLFRGAALLSEQWDIFGVPIELPLSRIGLCLLTAFVLTTGIIFTFGNKIAARVVPDEYKNRASAKFKKDNSERSGKLGKLNKAFLGTATAVITIVLILFSLSDIGFYDDYVKLSGSNAIYLSNGLFYEVPYSDLQICRAQGYYNDENEFINYENAYILYYDGGCYEIGEIAPNSDAQKMLEEIAAKYNKEIIQVKSAEDIDEYFGN